MTDKKWLVFNTFVLFVWVGILSFLLYRTYWGTPFEKTGLLEQHFMDRTVWYGVYAGNKKIGAAKASFREVGEEIIISRDSTVNLVKKDGGEPDTLIENLQCVCGKDYSIKSFLYSRNSQSGKETVIEGRVEDGLVLFFIDNQGKKRVHKVTVKENEVYLPVTLIPVIHQQKPAPQTVFLTRILDIMNTRVIESRVMLEQIIPVKVGVNVESVYKYVIDGSSFWANETGTVIKEQGPANVTLYAQPEAIAQKPEGKPIFDYTSLPFFKANKVIVDPEAISSMTVKIEGISPEILESENFVKPLPDKTFVIHKMTREDLKKASYTLPSLDESAMQYLAPDRWVSSDYGPLKKTGKIYAGANDNDAFELMSYLTSYVHNLIKTSPQFPLRDSATILDHREGDYIEKTLMFATYARAGGLPTRLMGGLVYKNGYFFFHTWPEVWVGKWAPVDPALYQFPADATHIPLITGSLTDIISKIDELKSINLKILEAS